MSKAQKAEISDAMNIALGDLMIRSAFKEEEKVGNPTEETGELTLEQQAMNSETWRHIDRVRHLMAAVIENILFRMDEHDQSKLASPEVEIFAEFTPKLKETVYGSEDYKEYLRQMKPALDHHYGNNSHHPEHFEDGVDDMDLLDLIEMVCDWKAAGERHEDGGNLLRSIKINTERFKLSPQLAKILNNTADFINDH